MNKLLKLLIFLLITACSKDPEANINQVETTISPICCNQLYMGMFELEDGIIYPSEDNISPFGWNEGDPVIDVDQFNNTIEIRSFEKQFCCQPLKLYVKKSNSTKFECVADFSCESSKTSQGESVLNLTLTPGFFVCAVENTDDFWFVLPYKE